MLTSSDSDKSCTQTKHRNEVSCISARNRQVLVGGDHLLLIFFFAFWDNIYECMCCYNRCDGNVVKRFWAL